MTKKEGAKPAEQAQTAKEETPQAATSAQGDAQGETAQAAADAQDNVQASAQGDKQQGPPAEAPELTALEFFRQAAADELAAQGVRIRENGEERPPVSADLLKIVIEPDAVIVVTVDGQKLELAEVPQ
jgi:hypothetical protein